MGYEETVEEAGIAYVSLFEYESGRARPKIENILRLSEALGCAPWTVEEFEWGLERAVIYGDIERPVEKV
jgi:transcriptional regulator with XRE-family HTH domain